jgi:hypothetical protein
MSNNILTQYNSFARDLWRENATLDSLTQCGVYRNPEMCWVESAIHEACVDSITLPASNVEYTRASLNKKAKTKPNYLILLFSLLFLSSVGLYSPVGIAIQDGLERSGDRIPVEGEFYRARPDRPWGPPSLLHNVYRVSFPWVKLPGRGVYHSPQSRAEVKQRVKLYLYSPTASWWQVLEGKFLSFFLTWGELGSMCRIFRWLLFTFWTVRFKHNSLENNLYIIKNNENYALFTFKFVV